MLEDKENDDTDHHKAASTQAQQSVDMADDKDFKLRRNRECSRKHGE